MERRIEYQRDGGYDESGASADRDPWVPRLWILIGCGYSVRFTRHDHEPRGEDHFSKIIIITTKYKDVWAAK